MRIVKKPIRNLPEKASFFVLTLPSTLIYTVFMIVPIVLGFYFSMTDWNGMARDYEFIGIRNFVSQFSNRAFHASLSFTLTYALVVVFSITILSFFLAVFLNNMKSRLKGLYKTLLFFPALLAPIVVSLIFKQIYSGVLPWLGKSLGLSFLSKNLMANMSTLKGTIEFVHIWYGIPVPTVLFLSGLQMVPDEVNEAAIIDGTNFFQRLWYIIIPYMIPIISIVLVLTLKQSLMVYDIIMGLTLGGPGTRTHSLSLLIYMEAFRNFRVGYAASISITVFFIMLIISALQITLFNKKDVNAG